MWAAEPGTALVAMARQGDWELVGIELNAEACRRARARGLDVRHGDLNRSDLAAESFDLIRMGHVLEHFPDPLDALRRAYALLRPGGTLFGETPDVTLIIPCFNEEKNVIGSHRNCHCRLPNRRAHVRDPRLRRRLHGRYVGGSRGVSGCPSRLARQALPQLRYHVETSGFGYQAQFLPRLIHEGVNYMELPLIGFDREGSTSINVKNLLSVGHSLLSIALRRLRVVLFE